jgi:glycosyltransferase involved in cell wall biosynthesis
MARARAGNLTGMEWSEAAVPEKAAENAAGRIRLLIVNSTLHIGGAEQIAASLAQHLDATAFAVRACYLKQPGLIAEQMQRAGVDVRAVPGLLPGKRDYLTFLKLRRLIRRERIEVIHTHDVHGLIDGALCRLTTRSVRHVHSFHFGNYPRRRGMSAFFEKLLWRVPDALISVGHEQARTLRQAYRIPESRLRVVWNGVDAPAPLAEPAPAGPAADVGAVLAALREPGVPLIASVSTLIPQKGLEHLVAAAGILHARGERFRLVIAGRGGLLEKLQEQSRRLGLGSVVHFPGWVPQASQRLLPLCDIFVQSSLWEAMSVVVLEAMAAGKPMAITAVGENPHVVEDGRTGLVVPPGDAPALAAALGRLLRDPALREALGASARQRYREAFTTRHMVDSHQRLYRSLVEPGLPSRSAA